MNIKDKNRLSDGTNKQNKSNNEEIIYTPLFRNSDNSIRSLSSSVGLGPVTENTPVTQGGYIRQYAPYFEKFSPKEPDYLRSYVEPDYVQNYVEPLDVQEKRYYKPSDEIVNYIKNTEKFEPNVYLDGNGYETIGYGFKDPKIVNKYRKTGISKIEALELFDKEIEYQLTQLKKFDWWNDLKQGQKDALLSLHYNIGETQFRNSPKMLAHLRNGNWEGVISEMDHGYNDKKNGGLRTRRDFERKYFIEHS